MHLKYRFERFGHLNLGPSRIVLEHLPIHFGSLDVEQKKSSSGKTSVSCEVMCFSLISVKACELCTIRMP